MRLFRRAVPAVVRPAVEVPPARVRPFRPSPGTEDEAAARIARFTAAEQEVWEWGQVTATFSLGCVRGGPLTEVDSYLLTYQINREIEDIEGCEDAQG